jgi:hypothetical protein
MNDDKTYIEKLTLDEIADNDLEMTRDAIKNASKHHFGHDMNKAVAFIREALGKTLVHLGVSHPAPPGNSRSREAMMRHAAKIDREMKERQIRIEHRNNYKGDDMWRCGLYIYQRDELVTFISDVLTQRRTEVDPISMKIGKETQGYLVITNARLEDTKRIFLMPGIAKGNGGVL